jgi:predicted small metal-binding protein
MMGKISECHKVNPSSECHHVVPGATEEEIRRRAAEHAKSHGLNPSPELLAKVKAYIEEESSGRPSTVRGPVPGLERLAWKPPSPAEETDP